MLTISRVYNYLGHVLQKHNTCTSVNQLLREEFHQQILWPKTLNTYCSCTVLVPTYDIYTVVMTQEKVLGGGVSIDLTS